MANATVEAIDRALGRAAETGALGTLEIEYWFGGGLPPPHYRSDQFRMFESGGKAVMVFAVMGFDKTLTPPEVHEKWTLNPTSDQIMNIASQVRQSHLISTYFAEEAPNNIPSGFSYEVIVSAGSDKVAKRYYKTMPSVLSALKDELVTLTKTKGPHGRYHQGKKLP
jgi:hypothetical protein